MSFGVSVCMCVSVCVCVCLCVWTGECGEEDGEEQGSGGEVDGRGWRPTKVTQRSCLCRQLSVCD